MDAIIQFTKTELAHNLEGHDFYHAQRVTQLALALYQKEVKEQQERDQKMISAMGYLHDTIDPKLFSNLQAQKEKLVQLLQKEQFSEEEIQTIMYVIEHLSFSKNKLQQQPLPFIGQCVQDADRLDALGAIGIARVFAFGGQHQQSIYDPDNAQNSIQHFYNKLLQLDQYMNTQTAALIAKEKIHFMRIFLTRFWRDWDAELNFYLKGETE